MKRILFFGDSLTAGYGLHDPASESVPGLIQQKINAEKLPFEVVNAGLSGDTTAGGLNRLNYWLAGTVDVFILELGANDFMRGVPPSVIFKNLQTIIEKVKAKYPDAKLALMGMELPEFVSGPLLVEIRGSFRRLAKEGQSLEDMLAYVDENGNISSTPPDPTKKKNVKTEDIVTGSRNNESHNAMMIRKGKVTFFNTSKGFGFIKDTQSGQSVFVHNNALTSPIKENDMVTFETVKDLKGVSAIKVKVIR